MNFFFYLLFQVLVNVGWAVGILIDVIGSLYLMKFILEIFFGDVWPNFK